MICKSITYNLIGRPIAHKLLRCSCALENRSHFLAVRLHWISILIRFRAW